MKNFAKSKGKRITAVLLCAVMCIMSLPLSAFAFTAEEGKTVDAYYGDRYFGSDGDYYYTSEEYTRGCMHKRNRHLVDNSSACIAYLTESKGGTAYTVDYAAKHGLTVFNIADCL